MEIFSRTNGKQRLLLYAYVIAVYYNIVTKKKKITIMNASTLNRRRLYYIIFEIKM